MIYGERGPWTERSGLRLDKRVTEGPHSWPSYAQHERLEEGSDM